MRTQILVESRTQKQQHSNTQGEIIIHMVKMQLIMQHSLRDQTMDLVHSTSSIHYVTVFGECQPFGTNSRFLVQFAKPQIQITGFNFFHANFYKKKRKRKKDKIPAGL